jgi:hypothetical protein
MTTPPAIQLYDALWNGTAHRNFCVSIRNGKTTVRIDGMPDYQLYFVRTNAKRSQETPVFAEGLETPGKIDVDTPDEPHTNGHVCLGVAT